LNKTREKRYFVAIGVIVPDEDGEEITPYVCDKWWDATQLAETMALILDDNEQLVPGVVAFTLPEDENDPRAPATLWCPVEETGKIDAHDLEEGLEMLDKVEDDRDRRFKLQYMRKSTN